MDGEQRGERGAPSACPPCITANRLWVIFSSFHGRAMNNLSLLSQTQAPLQPAPLISPSAGSPGPAAPRIASLTLAFYSLSLPCTPNQVFFFFFVSRGVLQDPEINWGCGWMTSGPSFIKVWVLEVCRVYNEVYIS